jgi:CheY-like chemotaxis protein
MMGIGEEHRMELQVKQNQRILVIENEPVISYVCHKILTKQGFAVDVVSDGKKAIVSLNTQHYDLCILDLYMLVMDGIQLHEYLSNNVPKLNQGIIFTTGDINDNQLSGFLNGPDKVFLEKPFTSRELIIAVEMALN